VLVGKTTAHCSEQEGGRAQSGCMVVKILVFDFCILSGKNLSRSKQTLMRREFMVTVLGTHWGNGKVLPKNKGIPRKIFVKTANFGCHMVSPTVSTSNNKY